MSRRGGRGGGRGILYSGIGHGIRRNFNRSNNRNKRQELEKYPHINGPDVQTAMFNKVKEHLILKIQIEFVNGSDI